MSKPLSYKFNPFIVFTYLRFNAISISINHFKITFLVIYPVNLIFHKNSSFHLHLDVD